MSENIVDGFGELRKFCKQVALLLKEAREMMKDKDWKRANPAEVFDTSRSIDDPKRWLPYEFCRFFKNAKYPSLLSYVAVNVGDPEGCPIDCALCSAGVLDFQDTMNPNKGEHWWSRWHLYILRRRKDDGTPCVDEPPGNEWPKEQLDQIPAGLSKVTTLAYPLVKITDPEALREKIVKPLLKIIEGGAKGSKAAPSDRV